MQPANSRFHSPLPLIDCSVPSLLHCAGDHHVRGACDHGLCALCAIYVCGHGLCALCALCAIYVCGHGLCALCAIYVCGHGLCDRAFYSSYDHDAYVLYVPGRDHGAHVRDHDRDACGHV
jgi:hypothetical protein